MGRLPAGASEAALAAAEASMGVSLLAPLRESLVAHDGGDCTNETRLMGRVSRDRRARRDLHALNPEGMVLCNPRDREAAHRAEMEGIATEDRAAVTCRKCLSLLYERDRGRDLPPS
jgi:cell wall assembly regulator SMI1